MSNKFNRDNFSNLGHPRHTGGEDHQNVILNDLKKYLTTDAGANNLLSLTQPNHAFNESNELADEPIANSHWDHSFDDAPTEDLNLKLLEPDEHTIIVTDGTTEQVVTLCKDLYLIGRDISCDMRLSSGFVSRCHAHLRFRIDNDGHTGYEIIDGDLQGKPSKNGLLLDGNTAIKRHYLRHGDIIAFAPEAHLLYLSPKSHQQ